jgi:AhpD family alkylhydroperoxidase
MDSGRRRYYRLGDVLQAVREMLRSRALLRRTPRADHLEPDLVEHLHLVVSRVNGCTVCVYEHSARALRQGTSDEELEQLLRLDIGAFPPQYAVALAFAQHYAEAEGSPDDDVAAALVDRYGDRRAEQILAHLAVAYVASTLTGTYESFVDRLHRNPVPSSSVAAELLVAMTVGPSLLVRDLQRLRLHRYDRVLPLVAKAWGRRVQ